MEAVERDIVLRNSFKDLEPVERDITLVNVLLPDPAARIVEHTWDVTLDGVSIKNSVTGSIRINLDQGSFTNDVRLGLSGTGLLANLEKHKGSGEDVLVITIDGAAYSFMVETVEIERSDKSAGISVWGRTLTAVLNDVAYSDPVTKVWAANVLASEVVAELAPGFTIRFEIEDWVIPGRVLSAEAELPLSVINRIAEAQGGIVRSGLEGELIVRPAFSVSPADLSDAAAVETFYEFDGVLPVLRDQREIAEGWEAVVVEGRSSISDEPALILELDEDRNQGRTTFKPGQDAFVRVYPRPFGIAYEHQITLGQAVKLGSFTHTIEDEEILVADGRAVSRYPIFNVDTLDFDGRVLSSPSWQAGGQEIIFEVNEGCSGSALLHLSYIAQYDLWRVTANEEGKAILCIEEAA